MRKTYIDCLKKLKEFRKSLKLEKDIKRGKLYFSWIDNKTDKIRNEENIEKEYNDNKITLEEMRNKKEKITEIIQLDKIYGFKDIVRWANITRMKKVSILRLNFSGSIGAISGDYLNLISKRMCQEF